MRIDINGQHHETDHHSLTGTQIMALGHHDHGTLFRWEGDRRDHVPGHEIVHLREGDRFMIVAQGHERCDLTIEVDGQKCLTDRREMTGTEIKQLARRPAGNMLYRLEARERIRVEDRETVHLHEDERFITLPPVGHAA
ncbi:MAG: multiubiquitin domain-containing protein [Candidatus Baltobacteraceae bacterium]